MKDKDTNEIIPHRISMGFSASKINLTDDGTLKAVRFLRAIFYMKTWCLSLKFDAYIVKLSYTYTKHSSLTQA